MIFVTGGTGFLGAHLLAELANQSEPVIAIKRAVPKGSIRASSTSKTEKLFSYKFGEGGEDLFQKIKWVEGDIMDPWSLSEAMQGVKDVYHCAAEVDLRDDNPDSIIKTAEKGTENMVNAALALGVEKFCHVSSVAALGNPPEGMITEECFEDFNFKNSPYAIGKHLAEQQVWRAHAEGLKVVVVSPSIILGPWSDLTNGSISMFPFIDKISRFYTSGTMGFVDVRDVVETMLRLMKNGPYNERFNVSSENLNFKDFFSSIASGINKPAPTIELNAFTLKVFQKLNNLFSSQKISSTMVEHATGRHIFSNTKVMEALKHEFKPVRQTIAETAKYYLNERGRK
ncbi:MAG TPA: NAD-dependent epimerase/dehydratase family protein [Bacteroidia bacterium]|jgi:dihydroflavonol-4-reductase|nr:NAD-dependent epimerase/dehydratase family protein [Bacteroidia bacterium]